MRLAAPVYRVSPDRQHMIAGANRTNISHERFGTRLRTHTKTVYPITNAEGSTSAIASATEGKRDSRSFSHSRDASSPGRTNTNEAARVIRKRAAETATETNRTQPRPGVRSTLPGSVLIIVVTDRSSAICSLDAKDPHASKRQGYECSQAEHECHYDDAVHDV
jgi:hypothetical protein